MARISVVIPIYNVEKYLEQCLNSVINQTFKDIEIICINDCSTDGSLAILQDFASKDNRIKLIDLPKNHGVSYARNKGIEESSGDYITFLDPDDWWEKYLVEKTLSEIQKEEADVVLFCHNEYKNNKIIPKKDKIEKVQDIINGTDYTKYMQDVSIFVWDKVYKKELIKNNDVRFTEKIHPTEDVLFSLELYSNKPKIVFMAECFYNYRLNRDGSAMNNYNILVSNQIKAFKTLLDSGFYKKAEDEFKLLCMDIIFGGLVYFYLLTRKKQFVLKDFIELKKLFPYMKEKIPANLLERIKGYEFLLGITTVNLKNGVSCLKS